MSSAVTIPFTFAQLCKELSKVEVSAATQFDLYKDCSGRIPWSIPITDFIAIFFNLNGAFAMDCSGSADWEYLNNWCGGGSCTGGAQAVGPFADVSLNVVQLVMNQWAEDINVGVDCWTICSKMQITEELLDANNLCNLRCNVCCALCAGELAQALNAAANDKVGAGTGSGIGGPRTPSIPVRALDRLVLSVLFTNSNIKVNPVELRLHFQTIMGDTWRRVNTFPDPKQGDWAPIRGGIINSSPSQVTTIRINQEALCSGMIYKEFEINDYFKDKILTIRGQGKSCPNNVFSQTATYRILTDTFTIFGPGGYVSFRVGYISHSPFFSSFLALQNSTITIE